MANLIILIYPWTQGRTLHVILQQFTQTFSVCRNMKNRFGFAFLGQHFMHDSTTHFIDDHRAQTLR